VSTRTLILFSVSGGLGVILLVNTVANWNQSDKVNKERLADLTSQMNDVTDKLVNACLADLPSGSEWCDLNLRKNVDDACESTNNQIDACKDNRVSKYYETVSMNKQSS
jgi:hypothetical protein